MTTEEMQSQIESMMPTPKQIVDKIDKRLEEEREKIVHNILKESNGMNWISTKIRFPKAGEQVLAACKNKNMEDGIWLYDLCYYYPNTGWESRVNWEDVICWTYIDEPKED